MPTGASIGSNSNPSAASLMPNSLAEHNMPEDSMPRNFAFLIEKPGKVAPIKAQGTFTPILTLGAPHTICNTSSLPVLDFTHFEPVGFRVFFDSQYLGHNNLIKGGRYRLNASPPRCRPSSVHAQARHWKVGWINKTA
jgi:hypothetical protein